MRILCIEPAMQGAVQIQHPDHAPVDHQWQHEFRIGRAVAGDVAGKGMHIGDDLDLHGRRAGATDTAADVDAGARHPALKRPQHQRLVLPQVEASPVQTGHGSKDQCAELREVCQRITLAGDQSLSLAVEQSIDAAFALAAPAIAGEGVLIAAGAGYRKPVLELLLCLIAIPAFMMLRRLGSL